ncbi:MAG: hypothetical protein AB7N80_04685 [Bdellovibrionales bacterium]
MKSPILLALFVMISFAWHTVAQSEDSWYFHPQVGVGFNSQQGTSYVFGLDLGMAANQNWRMGLTGHYAAGDRASRDREYGGGAFVSYAERLGEVFIGHIRQELLYLDVRNPIDPEPAAGPNYESELGLASATSLGVTVRVGDNIALSGGYRFVAGITNSDLADGRSGPTFGLMVGL